jgi:hypothetical protein
MLRAAACLAIVLCFFGRASALDMNVKTDDAEKLAYMNLWGEIVTGDEAKFRSLITPYIQRGYILFKVNIFTIGGDVGAAMSIGNQIRLLRSRTVAPSRFARIVDDQRVVNPYPSCWFDQKFGTSIGPQPVERAPWCDCASACFLIWASGIVREGNHVGVHRTYYLKEDGRKFGNMSGPEAQRMYQAQQQNFQQYVDALDVPRSISERLWATGSQSMHYLTQDELALMQSTPHLEEQTMARCGRDKTEHMSVANGWTSTQDVAHVNCYRGILKEFMKEGAEAYLRDAGLVVAAVVEPARSEANKTRYWYYNDSMFDMRVIGKTTQFVFTRVRQGLSDIGVKEGAVIFEGRREGQVLQGKAFVFSKSCGAVGYPASGTISPDGRRAEIRGDAPYVDAKCARVSSRPSEMAFQADQ